MIRVTRPDRGLVEAFLSGTSDRLLQVAYDEDQPHVRFGVERDRCVARAFFQAGPQAIRTLQARHSGIGRVTREQFVSWIRAEVDELLR